MSDTLHPLTQRIRTDLIQFKDADTVDLVVIGSGGAGFSAALNAAIDGARVLLVERMAHVGGTRPCQQPPPGCRARNAAWK